MAAWLVVRLCRSHQQTASVASISAYIDVSWKTVLLDYTMCSREYVRPDSAHHSIEMSIILVVLSLGYYYDWRASLRSNQIHEV